MIQRLAVCFGIGLTFAAVAVNCAGEGLPVSHNEPIKLRVLNGQTGKPLVHVHLNLYAGYDEADIRRQSWHEETITDEQGQASLSSQLINLPFLQVWPTKTTSCQGNPRKARFSVERIRRDGLSTPNRCGTVMEKDTPGVFIVYAFAKEKKGKVLPSTSSVQSTPAPKVEPVESHPAPSAPSRDVPFDPKGHNNNTLRAALVFPSGN